MMEGRERTPDLVILDLNLPRMNGFDVLACMKAESSLGSIPVIVMTGSLRKEDEVRARSLGAADYCIKPATFIEIERARGCLKAQLEIINCNKREKRGPSTDLAEPFHVRSSSGPTVMQREVHHGRTRRELEHVELSNTSDVQILGSDVLNGSSRWDELAS